MKDRLQLHGIFCAIRGYSRGYERFYHLNAVKRNSRKWFCFQCPVSTTLVGKAIANKPLLLMIPAKSYFWKKSIRSQSDHWGAYLVSY